MEIPVGRKIESIFLTEEGGWNIDNTPDMEVDEITGEYSNIPIARIRHKNGKETIVNLNHVLHYTLIPDDEGEQ
jgi:hypothetical protein